MITLIIGRESNLSQSIFKLLENSVLISSRELSEDIKLLDKYKDKHINIIFNNFQSAPYLNDLSKIDIYIHQSIQITSSVLQYVKEFSINKIIYNSSSSLYGNNPFCSEIDTVYPSNLHSSLKLSNELLIETYCKQYNIDYTITRIFNMYGGNDKFSIISKIIESYKNNTTLNIINNGNGIRDFIHVYDVSLSIIKLLNSTNINLINIGTGKGISIMDILDNLKRYNIYIETKNIDLNDTIDVSISNNTKLLSIIDKTFIDLNEYILKKCKESLCVE